MRRSSTYDVYVASVVSIVLSILACILTDYVHIKECLRVKGKTIFLCLCDFYHSGLLS